MNYFEPLDAAMLGKAVGNGAEVTPPKSCEVQGLLIAYVTAMKVTAARVNSLLLPVVHGGDGCPVEWAGPLPTAVHMLGGEFALYTAYLR
jgi:hypothetical protein